MLKVHLIDGNTMEVDLQNGAVFREWMERFQDPVYQRRITGMTIIDKGVQYSLTKPQTITGARLTAEPVHAAKGAERVTCFTDDSKIHLMVHSGQHRAACVSIEPRWKRVYRPKEQR